jgi:hypothetical protein
MSRIDELLPDAWVGPRRSHVPGRDGDLGLARRIATGERVLNLKRFAMLLE